MCGGVSVFLNGLISIKYFNSRNPGATEDLVDIKPISLCFSSPLHVMNHAGFISKIGADCKIFHPSGHLPHENTGSWGASHHMPFVTTVSDSPFRAFLKALRSSFGCLTTFDAVSEAIPNHCLSLFLLPNSAVSIPCSHHFPSPQRHLGVSEHLELHSTLKFHGYHENSQLLCTFLVSTHDSFLRCSFFFLFVFLVKIRFPYASNC